MALSAKFCSAAVAFLVGGIAWGAAPQLDRQAACFWGVRVVDGDSLVCHEKQLRLDGVIRYPLDHFREGAVLSGCGHQWNSVLSRIISC
jgi:hypothetical protein